MNCGPIPCPEQNAPARILRCATSLARALGASGHDPRLQHGLHRWHRRQRRPSQHPTLLQRHRNATPVGRRSLRTLPLVPSAHRRFTRRPLRPPQDVPLRCRRLRLASLGCGIARHIGELLFARCLQGIGGALLVPNSLALLSAEFEGAARAKAIGTWSGFSAIMTALGPVLGGWLVQHGSWRWAFFLNLPIAVVTIWVTLAKVPTREVPSQTISARHHRRTPRHCKPRLPHLQPAGMAERPPRIPRVRQSPASSFSPSSSSPSAVPRHHCLAATLPESKLHRRESADLLSLRRTLRNALLPSPQPHSDTGLHPRSVRSRTPAHGLVDVLSLSLGRRPAPTMGSPPAAHPRPRPSRPSATSCSRARESAVPTG